jgi:FkbH-like protein
MTDVFKNKELETPANYAKKFLEVKKIAHQLNPVKIAFLSSYTSEVLSPYVSVELAKKGYYSDNYFAPFNQFEQETLDQDSDLYIKNPDIVIVHNMIEDMYPDLVINFSKYSKAELNSIADQVIGRCKTILESLRGRVKADIVVVNFSMINIDEIGSVYSTIRQQKNQYIQDINRRLLSLCNEMSSCYSVDYMDIVCKVGVQEWIDRKLYLIARIPFTGQGQIEFGKILAKTIFSIKNQPYKCLVLDLDNTLWGGVIGEDGMSGIQLSEYYPGNVFKHFQRTVLNLRNQGVLLAIASKNNFNDATEVFQKHSDCLLKESDFAAMEINWNDKATNIQKIAKKLNIGLDSIVFFDDNPTERQWVSDKLPQVKVIDVPEDVMLYSKTLYDSNCFNFLTMTEEDKNRTEMIQQNQQRAELNENSKDMDSFLTSLNIVASIGVSDSMTVDRIAQLTNKTNQFNLTTRRYSTAEINEFVESGDIVLHISVEDCFGEYGISGVAIVKKNDKYEWVIDTFLLSCRIIGKKIESALLNRVINILKRKKVHKLYGQYIDSKKNHLTKNFYKGHNFNLVDKENGIWEYDLQKKTPTVIDFIKINRT